MEEQKHFKRGLNIYLYYLTIPAFIFFFLLNYSSRNIKIEALDVGLMISVVTFLFGFLITITFSMSISKVSSLKEALASETGRLVSLYSLSKGLGKGFNERISNLIDGYTRITLKDYTNYSASREYVNQIYESCDNMEINSKNQEVLANSFMYILGELEPIREKLEYLTGRRVEWSLKFSNYLMGLILIFLLYFNRGDPFTNALFVVLSTTVIFLFLIIEDYDDLRIGDYTINISNAEQIFDLLGRPRYYPREILNRVKLEDGKVYRIGASDGPMGEQILELTYSPNIGMRVDRIMNRIKIKRGKKN